MATTLTALFAKAAVLMNYSDSTKVPIGYIAAVKIWLNEGHSAFCRLVAKITKATATISYAYPIALPADIFEISTVSHSVSGILMPREYERNGDKLYIHARALTSGDITITYLYNPATLDDSDEMLLDDSYAEAVATYGAMKYFAEIGDVSKANMYRGMLLSYPGLMEPDNPTKQAGGGGN